MFEFIKKMFKRVDDVRERIEDKMADILDKVQDNEKVDEVEKKLIVQGLKVGITYFTGACPLNDEQLAKIAAPIVESGINKINPKLSAQLRKH